VTTFEPMDVTMQRRGDGGESPNSRYDPQWSRIDAPRRRAGIIKARTGVEARFNDQCTACGPDRLFPLSKSPDITARPAPTIVAALQDVDRLRGENKELAEFAYSLVRKSQALRVGNTTLHGQLDSALAVEPIYQERGADLKAEKASLRARLATARNERDEANAGIDDTDGATKFFRHYPRWLTMRGRGEWLIYPPLGDQDSYTVAAGRLGTFEAARAGFAAGGKS
jgi:hypothetical protein